MRFDDSISAFASALADQTLAPPAQTRGREGAPDGKRFAVYRNNVAVGLLASLAARFPVTQRLVGEEFFMAMSRAFLVDHKPRSAMLMRFGGALPAFIDQFEPARDIAYLSDVARLEDAWLEAYHAAEAKPLELAALGSLDPDGLSRSRFVFHPAVRLLRFAHPAASIWAAHQGEQEPRAPQAWVAEDALIARPHAEVGVRILPRGGFEFASALHSGASLGEAHAAADFEGFDPGHHLVGLIEAGALTHIIDGETS